MVDELLTASQPDKKTEEATTVAFSSCRNVQILLIDDFDSDFQACTRLAAPEVVNSYYVGVDQLISTRELVFESLKTYSATYDVAALDLGEANAAPTSAELVSPGWSWATPLAPLTNEFRSPLNEGLLSPELSPAEILELIASSRSQVLRGLKSKIDRLRGLMRYLTVRIGVLIRHVGRPHFDYTFVGLQKSFHLLHGAHPPRYRAGLSSGRRSNFSGGCVQAISSNPV
jgi:hypothetical protein